jgi:Fe-S-cluster containining protein
MRKPDPTICERKLNEIEEEWRRRCPRPTARYRRYIGNLKPVTTHAECRGCEALCCRHAVPVVYHFEIMRWKAKGIAPLKMSYHTHYYPKIHGRPTQMAESEENKKRGYLIHGPTTMYGYRRKKADARILQTGGACVYLNRVTGKCGVYARRPESCRRWFCGRGAFEHSTWDSLLYRKAHPERPLSRTYTRQDRDRDWNKAYTESYRDDQKDHAGTEGDVVAGLPKSKVHSLWGASLPMCEKSDGSRAM